MEELGKVLANETEYVSEFADDIDCTSSMATSVGLSNIYDLHSPKPDGHVIRYGPEDAAKLDEVLASVNQLIECLNSELDEKSFSSADIVDKATRDEQTCGNSHELITDLKSVSTSKRLSSDEEIQKPGADKHNIDTCDKNLPHRNDGAITVKTGSRAHVKGIPNFNKLPEEAEVSLETELSEKKNESSISNILEQQMTSSFQLEGARVSNKALIPTEDNPFQESECSSAEQDKKNIIEKSDELSKLNQTSKTVLNFKKAKDSVKPGKNERPSGQFRKRTGLFRKSHSEIFSDKIDEFSPVVMRQSSTDSTTVCHRQQSPGETHNNIKGKEKRKLAFAMSLPIKALSLKENQNQAPRTSVVKQKTSKSKEFAEISSLSTNRTTCNCFQFQEEGNRKNSFFEDQNINDDKEKKSKHNKPVKRRKTFLIRQTKIGSYFRRSLSTDKSSDKEETNISSPVKKPADFSEKESLKQSLNLFNLKKFGSFSSATTPSPSEASVSFASNSGSMHQRKSPMRSKHYKNHNSWSSFSTFQVQLPNSEKEVSCSDIENDAQDHSNATLDSSFNPGASCNFQGSPMFGRKEGPSRRAIMDVASSKSSVNECKNPTMSLLENSESLSTSSLPRKSHLEAQQNNKKLTKANPAFQALTATDSDGSFRGSQDSLEENEFDIKNPNISRHFRGQKAFDSTIEQQSGLESVARLANKIGKKNKLRKSAKHSGKTSCSVIHDADEMAKRTWSPEGDCTWSNMSGRKVELESTRLQSLSELESDALQKVSLNRLHSAELGVSIVVPKDESKLLNRKVSMKKKYGVHLPSKEKNKEKNGDHVFGIPLVNVVENDQLLRLQKSASFATSLEYQSPEVANDSAPATAANAPGSTSSSSSSSCSGSLTSINNQHLPLNCENEEEGTATTPNSMAKNDSTDNISTDDSASLKSPANNENDNVFGNDNAKEAGNQTYAQSPNSAKSNTSTAAQPLRRRGAIAADSINQIDPYQSQLLEALSLSVSGNTHNQRRDKKRSLLPPTMAQVPYVVQKCCDHITKYGLDITGIFRVAGSRKRVKQLREEFDRGMDVTIDEDYNPHDVAALLKEFFRDLPEALLTRELYPAFIQIAKLPVQERLKWIRYLVWLLPLTHRDTLHTLLNFLAVVAAHSESTTDQSGKKIEGNKMNVTNLAVIFGPNILHRYKKSSQSNGENQYQVQSLEKPEESSAVIKVVEDLITNQHQLFQVPKEEHDEMLRTLKETDPEAVDFLLRRKAANHMREKSRQLSGNSSSPASSRKLTQISGLKPKKLDTNIEDLSANNDFHRESGVENSNIAFSDNVPRPYSTMRLSYQQATGHALLPVDESKQDKGTKLKFNRPFFKKPTSVQTDSYYISECNNCNELEEIVDDALESINTEPQTSTTPKRNLMSKNNRSMSFTEDDMQAILGSTIQVTIKNTNRPEPIIEENEVDCRMMCDTAHQEYLFNSRENDSKTGRADGEMQCIKISDLEAPSKLTENARNTSPDIIKRRGGFSLRYQTPSHDDFISSNYQVIEEETNDDFSHYNDLTVRMQEKQDNIKHKSNETDKDGQSNSFLYNAEKPSLVQIPGHEQLSSDHESVGRTSSFELNSNESCSSNDIYGGSNQETEYANRNQTLHLHPVTLSSINAALNSEPKPFVLPAKEITRPAFENITNEQPTSGNGSPDANRKKRLSGLSPRLQRQYGCATAQISVASYNLDTSPKLNGQIKKFVVKLNQQHENSKPEETTKKSVKPLNYDRFEVDSGHATCLNSNRDSQQDYHRSDRYQGDHLGSSHIKTNVAALVRRYSKDDLALTKDTRKTPGSKWTSPGLLGKVDANHNICQQHSKSTHSIHDNTRTSHGNNQLVWHKPTNDRKQLPETLV